jgi:cysteinyl-tRNA synthetase
MYVCGPTVYGPPHLGHGRFTLVYDILRRYLTFVGLDVRHVVNVTDVDDKIIERAAREGRTPTEVANESEAQWWEAMDALGALRPTDIPHATQYVPDMVALVDDLIQRGAAYETDDGVYMRVDAVEGYGLLAHQDLGSLRAGARVEAAEGKRSPLDFALWKKAKPGEPTWHSPWGPGRPGWHTECVVMSLDLLGEGFDLHGGGQDLIFPHHENERAQAVADHRDFARHWLHYALIMVRGQKMSKSLGNFTSIADLLCAHDPRAYRMLVLRAHYRSPIEVSPDTLSDAEKALERLDALARRLSLADPFDGSGGRALVREAATAVTGHGVDEDAVRRFVERMDDDLDAPAAMGEVFTLVTRANAAADAGETRRAGQLGDTVAILCGAVGLRLRAEVGDVDEETLALVTERDEARRVRDFARADVLRDRLTAAGWIVEDGADGTVVHR